jgi:hypothetical protein
MSNLYMNFTNLAQFSQPVIPVDLSKQGYPHASTTVFDNTAKTLDENVIIIDSRFRNWDHETQSHYTYYLGQTLEYVQSLELVDGYVISSSYVINEDNNMMTFTEHHTKINIEIPTGVYTITTLCTQITNLMNAETTHGYTYTCMVDPLKDKVVFHSLDETQIFGLLWTDGTEVLEDSGVAETLVYDQLTRNKTLKRVKTGKTRNRYRHHSVGTILGYLPIDLCGSHIYMGQQVYNLYPDEYVALHVTTGTHDDCKNVISHVNAVGNTGAFAILDLSQSNSRPIGTANRQYTPRRRFTHYFNPPVKFSQLLIEIKKADGSYYDFHGLDHYLYMIVQRVYDRQILGPVNQLF